MPELPHLDCTSEQRREEIVKNYIVHADDCIVLYGGRTVRSDANNRVIADRYYQFSCKSKTNENDEYVILCGSGAARHLCQLINQPMPPAFNPFIGANNGDNGGRNDGHDDNEEAENEWNPIRRKLYYAVQLFIIRYQETIKAGTKIFYIRQSLCDKSYINCAPQRFQYEGFMTIVHKYKTTIPRIIRELEAHGRVRHFNFNDLAEQAEQYVSNELPNIFRQLLILLLCLQKR